jgi:hypothetical protein
MKLCSSRSVILVSILVIFCISIPLCSSASDAEARRQQARNAAAAEDAERGYDQAKELAYILWKDTILGRIDQWIRAKFPPTPSMIGLIGFSFLTFILAIMTLEEYYNPDMGGYGLEEMHRKQVNPQHNHAVNT